MMTSRRRRLLPAPTPVVGIAVVVAVIVCAGVRAPAAAAAGNDRPGRAHFAMAETKFNLGKFEEAAVDYQAAYEAEPLPAFLFNIGQCYRNLGNYERAQFYFRRYVELAPRSPNRPDAEHLIAEMDRLADGGRAGAPPQSLASLSSPATGTRAGDARVQPFAPALARTGDAAGAPRPLYRRPWFWVGTAAVVAAAVAAGVFIARDDHQPSLQPIDAR